MGRENFISTSAGFDHTSAEKSTPGDGSGRPAFSMRTSPGPTEYYLLREGEQVGPYSLDQMRLWWRVGMLDVGQLFWQEGMAQWQPVSNLAGMLQADQMAQPAAAG